MKLCRGALRAIMMPLVRPLATAHGLLSSRQGWLVEIEDDSGRVGYGEATPLPEFGTEDLATCRSNLHAALSRLLQRDHSFSGGGLAGALTAAGEVLGDGHAAPCAAAAIEGALFDLSAKRNRRMLSEELRDWSGLVGPPSDSVATQALVLGQAPEEVFLNGQAAQREGFGAFKLKLAVSSERRDPARDVERVAALREAVGGGARLRLDANEAWSADEARIALGRLEVFGVDYVEQPVPRGDLVGLEALSRSAPIEVAADEALQGAGLAACLDARAAKILIVKPAALGGVKNSVRLFTRAREEGLRLVWSTLIDGAVGRSLCLALAVGLGPAEEVHGLGTAMLLSEDLCGDSLGEGRLSEGRIYPNAPKELNDPDESHGIGFSPSLPGGGRVAGDSGSPSFEIRSRGRE